MLSSLTSKSLIIIELMIIFVYVIPFLILNEGIGYPLSSDTDYHLVTVEYYSKYLFPNYSGWNPYIYGEYPQGQFYPSLFHWIAGGLAIFLGTIASVKLLILFTLIVTPISITFLLKKLRFDDLEIACSLILILSLLMIPLLFGLNYFPGGDFSSIFGIGFIPQAFSIPILFIYIGILLDSLENRKDPYLSSILFSILVLSHATGIILAPIILFSSCILSMLTKREKYFYITFLLKHLILSFILLGFWLIPGIAKYNNTSPAYLGFFDNLMPPPLVSFTLTFIGIIYMILVRDKRLIDIFIYLMFLSFLLLLNQIGFSLIPHPERFGLYPSIFILIIIGTLLAKFMREKNMRTNLHLFITIFAIPSIILFSILAYSYVNSFNEGSLNFNLQKPVYGKISLPVDLEFCKYYLFLHKYETFHGTSWNPNNDYASFILFYLNDSVNWIEFSQIQPSEVIKKSEDIKDNLPLFLFYHSKYFDVNYLLTEQPPKAFLGRFSNVVLDWDIVGNITKINGTVENIYLYHIGNHSQFEILNYKPIQVYGPWYNEAPLNETEQWKWFIDPDKVQKLITPDDLPEWVGDGKETVEVFVDNPEYIKLRVNSSHPVPIHIKISSYPNWHAYVDGEPVRIYRIPVNMMLIYGQGIVELKYEPILVDWVGLGLTIFGISYILYYLTSKRMKQEHGRKRDS